MALKLVYRDGRLKETEITDVVACRVEDCRIDARYKSLALTFSDGAQYAQAFVSLEQIEALMIEMQKVLRCEATILKAEADGRLAKARDALDAAENEMTAAVGKKGA